MVRAVSDVAVAVRRQFGDTTNSMVLEEDILRWINDGQLKIQRRTTSNRAVAPVINVVSGDNLYPLPEDFLKHLQVTLDGIRLQGVKETQLKVLYPDIGSPSAQLSVPKFFAIQPLTPVANIVLAPIPANAGELLIEYVTRPPLVHSSDDNLVIADEYFDTLVLYCLGMAKQLDGDHAAETTLKALFQQDLAEDFNDAKDKDDETYPVIRPSTGDMLGGW